MPRQPVPYVSVPEGGPPGETLCESERRFFDGDKQPGSPPYVSTERTLTAGHSGLHSFGGTLPSDAAVSSEIGTVGSNLPRIGTCVRLLPLDVGDGMRRPRSASE